MKRKLSLIISLCLMVVLMTGCGSSSIEGKWELSGETKHNPFNFVKNMEFRKDGTVVTDSKSFPFTEYEFDSSKDKDGNMSLIFKGIGGNEKYYLKEQKGNSEKLYLTNSAPNHKDEFKDMVLIKQE